LLESVGIEKERIRLIWISAPEGLKFSQEIERCVDEVEKMGPVCLRG